MWEFMNKQGLTVNKTTGKAMACYMNGLCSFALHCEEIGTDCEKVGTDCEIRIGCKEVGPTVRSGLVAKK